MRLKKNPCVFDCTSKSIIYRYEFKCRAIILHKEGVSAKEIWRRAGFDILKWKKDYCKDTIKDWKRIVARDGIEGLRKLRGIQAPGRPENKRLTDADKIKHLELHVKYLEAENDFLAKLRAKRAERNSSHNRSSRL